METTDTINALLIRWQDQRRSGAPVSINELCAEHPSLIDELTRRIAAFESMEQLLGLGQYATLPAPGTKPGVPEHLAEKLLPLGYEIVDVIDQGGMGVVYKAVQVKLRRTVALKMIAGVRVGPKQLGRFRVEVEAVARLQHPNIVQIYEVGDVDGHSYFSMEYVEGGTLAQKFATGPMPPKAAAELLEAIARAIHHAHTRGIVHRDMKPGNVLLAGAKHGDNGKPMPKIADFGLAKQLGSEYDHTATGDVIGTPCYMAPEQAQGHGSAIGPACDIYALGAILYEALTGRVPFQAKSVLETLRQVATDEPPSPRGILNSVPRDLEAICLKCLEKKPAHRYPTAEALADDLHRFLTGAPVVARPLSRPARMLKWARRRPAFTFAAILVLLTTSSLLGWGYIQRERQRAKVIQRAIEVAPQAQEILHRHCFECHGAIPGKAARNFLVLDRASLLDASRKNVVPGAPAHSRLVQRIEDGTMPPEEEELRLPRVSQQELDILKDWIAGGAPDFPPFDPASPPPRVVPHSELAAQVRDIFVTHCYECHQLKEAKGGIKILNHDLLLVKRQVVKPGHPEESELYQLLVTDDEKIVMPPSTIPQRLTAEEIETVRQWIGEGAAPFPHGPPKK